MVWRNQTVLFSKAIKKNLDLFYFVLYVVLLYALGFENYIGMMMAPAAIRAIFEVLIASYFYFNISGAVIKRICRYRAEINPMQIHERPLFSLPECDRMVCDYQTWDDWALYFSKRMEKS